MNKMTAHETEWKLKETFSRWGLPKTIVSDNGRQFVSEELSKFFTKNCIKYITSPPGNPGSNGQSENAVKSFKKNVTARLKDKRNQGKEVDEIVLEYLFASRTTKHITTEETPANLMMGRESRTRLSMIRENKAVEERNTVEQRIEEKQQTKTKS